VALVFISATVIWFGMAMLLHGARLWS
jgi:hypothetical protein